MHLPALGVYSPLDGLPTVIASDKLTSGVCLCVYTSYNIVVDLLP